MQRIEKKIRVYVDFDGTLTGASGDDTWDVIQPIEIQTTHKQEERDQLLKNRLDDERNLRFRMTPDALQFIRDLSANPDIDLVIVSRNYERYIQAVMRYHALSEDIISNIRIYDRKAIIKSKGMVVKVDALSHGAVARNFVCDDSKSDGASMSEACGALKNYHAKPNEFDWAAICRDVLYPDELVAVIKQHLSVLQSQRFIIDTEKHQHKITVLIEALRVVEQNGSLDELNDCLSKNIKWDRATGISETAVIIERVREHLRQSQVSGEVEQVAGLRMSGK